MSKLTKNIKLDNFKKLELDDFANEDEFHEKITKIFEESNKYAKEVAHTIDRYYLTGLSKLSIRKKKKIQKWIYKAMKGKLELC